MSEHTLKPCPFCGEQPAINHIEAHSHSFQINGFKMPDHPGSCVIECTCGAGLIDSDFDAVAARWNARAMPLPETNGDKERDVFEKWVSDQGVAADYRGDGIYGNPKVRRWREGFLAALELVRFPRDTEALRKENEQLKSNNSELLAALKSAYEHINGGSGIKIGMEFSKLWNQVRSAINNSEGGAA